MPATGQFTDSDLIARIAKVSSRLSMLHAYKALSNLFEGPKDAALQTVDASSFTIRHEIQKFSAENVSVWLSMQPLTDYAPSREQFTLRFISLSCFETAYCFIFERGVMTPLNCIRSNEYGRFLVAIKSTSIPIFLAIDECFCGWEIAHQSDMMSISL